MADALTEEVLAKARFTVTGGLPSIGELAEVTVALPAQARSLAIPNAAVHRIDGQVGVWVIRDGDLVFAPVKLGARISEGWVQVLGGLTKGEKIVLHSAQGTLGQQSVQHCRRATMISLAGRDILHGWGKFVLTGVGSGSADRRHSVDGRGLSRHGR